MDVSHLDAKNRFVFLFEVCGIDKSSTGLTHLISVSESIGVNPLGISSVTESIHLESDSLLIPGSLPGSHNWLE